MRPGLAIIGGLLAAAPANAQYTNCMANGPFVNCNSTDGSMTNCNQTGAIWNCNTIGGQTTNQYNGQGAAAGLADFVRSIRARKTKARVAKALKAGDCDTAMQEAIDSDDMAYADEVRTYCAAGR